MRFLLSAFIWFFFIGGLWFYTAQRDAGLDHNRPLPVVDQAVHGVFALELTTTFSTEADPFALQTDDSPGADIELRLNGKELPLPVNSLQRGAVLRLENVQGVLRGHNELYIQANPPLSEANLEHGVRIKFFADGNLLADHSSWSGSGAPVSDSFAFEYSTTGEDGHGQH